MIDIQTKTKIEDLVSYYTYYTTIYIYNISYQLDCPFLVKDICSNQ